MIRAYYFVRFLLDPSLEEWDPHKWTGWHHVKKETYEARMPPRSLSMVWKRSEKMLPNFTHTMTQGIMLYGEHQIAHDDHNLRDKFREAAATSTLTIAA